MSEFWISITSLVLGIVATIIVSHYYYRRTFKKTSLTPYIQFYSLSLKGIDSKVRKELKIKYNEQSIENLFEIQFLIANTGNNTIKNIIEPLSLTMPNNCNLLDAHIIHISPTGRKVDLKITPDRSSIVYDFSLLNSGDFFIVKLLIDGNPSHKDFNFSIEAEELSPILETSYLPGGAIGHINEKKSFEKVPFFFGLGFIGTGLVLFNLIRMSWYTIPSFTKFSIFDYIFEIGIDGFSILISSIPAFICMFLGIVMIIGSFSDFVFPKKKEKFIVPDDKELLKRRLYSPFDYLDF
ncbi:hypothetical protein [Planococcus chinensis]|uniref:Uncharacterized protein n=1 Tax=Planococcus chinensis TaxID=272917 RepID=A0ABW4QJ19_9BACL